MTLRLGRLSILICIAAVCLGLPLAAQEELPQEFPDEDEIFRVDVNLITLMFSVKDAQGRFVNDLAAGRFRVYEDGVEQELRYFEGPSNQQPRQGGLWLAFLIDVSGSTFSTRSEQLLAARTFFDNLQQFTQVGIYGFTDQLLEFQAFTSNRSAALQAFAQARQHLGRTSIYASLNSLVQQIKAKARPQDRKVIILISDGMDDDYVKSAQSTSLARINGVNIYTVLVPSASQLYIHPDAPPTPEGEEREKKRQAFARLSRGTDGLHFSGFEAVLDFDQTLAQITESVFGNLYRVAYTTSDPRRPKEDRDIRIRVTENEDYEVSMPFKRLPRQMQAKKELIVALFASKDEKAPLDIDTSYREISAALDVLQPRALGGETGQPFRLKINPLSLAGDKLGVRTQLGIVGQLIDRQGNEVARLREILPIDLRAREIANGQGIIYTNKLLAPKGTYNFRVAVLEVSTWKMTAFETVVQIGTD
ncbi:MAG TPA: VWA domain-containing protein [Acidobacteriota bacterium]|nr:VWA domain-containing protein [Acidobacteriota bacterium]